MVKKGNGLAKTNDLLEQLLKIGHEQNQRLGNIESRIGSIEDFIRQIATFTGQERSRWDSKFEALGRRVEALERKAA